MSARSKREAEAIARRIAVRQSAATEAAASGDVATHAAVTTSVHGITAFGASLVNDANAAAGRSTLGLGTAAVEAAGAFAAASHTHAPSDITGTAVVTADARLSDARTPTAHTHSVGDVTGLGSLATQSGTFSGTSSGTNTGDQSTFGTIAVSGQSNVVADAANDTLTLVAGANITITTDAGKDTVTITGSGGGGLADGDYGDITVGGTGTTLTIDPGVVTLAKMADMATDSFLGRDTAGTGAPEVLSVATAKTLLNLSGTNTGDQTTVSGNAGTATALATGRTIAITGDVTYTSPSFDGSANVTAAGTIANDAVTYAKMQNTSAASVLLGRGSAGGAGNVEEVTLGSGLSMSGTVLSASAGSSPVVYVATGADVAINNAADQTIVTRDVTSVGATDILDVTADFVILNNSTATRVYVITLDFDGLFDVEFTTGALATSATLMHPFTVRGVLGIRSTSLAYATFVCEGQLAAGIASGTDTTMAATHLRAAGWGTTASDASGTCTVALKIRSANNTATQTCRLLSLVVNKYTPT